MVLKRSWPAVSHCIIGDNNKTEWAYKISIWVVWHDSGQTYNLEFDGLPILFNSADFLQKDHYKITTCNDFTNNQFDNWREEAYKVNTNGADVAIQVGIILYKTKNWATTGSLSNEYRERERERDTYSKP